MKNFNYNKYYKFFFSLLLLALLTSCGKGFFKKVDTRKVPVNVNERAQNNIREGKGFKLGSLGGKSGVFDFATSNEMWRASIELLDFTPLSNVDYSGGIIITDWFSDKNLPKESMKITIKFLSNEIRADGIKVSTYKKTCIDNNCKTLLQNSNLTNEIKLAILKKATLIKKKELKKKN